MTPMKSHWKHYRHDIIADPTTLTFRPTPDAKGEEGSQHSPATHCGHEIIQKAQNAVTNKTYATANNEGDPLRVAVEKPIARLNSSPNFSTESTNLAIAKKRLRTKRNGQSAMGIVRGPTASEETLIVSAWKIKNVPTKVPRLAATPNSTFVLCSFD